MSAELRMGVIGGGISRAHLPAERDVEGMRTVAVCGIDEVGARATIEKFVRRAHGAHRPARPRRGRRDGGDDGAAAPPPASRPAKRE